MPKISVVIPFYNASQYIEIALEYLLHQSMNDYELIFVNDGSTDNGVALLKELTKDNEKVRILEQENQGQAVARNYGIEESRGEYLCFVDIDDTISFNMLERLYKEAIIKEADIVWCNADLVKDGVVIGYLDNQAIWTNDMNKDYILNNASPWRKLIKRSLIINQELQFPRIRFYEDLAIVPQYCLNANRICYVKEALYHYVQHEGSTMHQLSYNKKLECIFDCMEYLWEGFKDYREPYHEELEYLFIDHLLHAASLRFFTFEEGKSKLNEIVLIMKIRFPNWKNNSYFKQKGWKYRLICKLFYKKQYWLLNQLLK